MTWRVAGSLTGDFNDDWSWDVGFQRSRNEFFVGAEDTVKDRLYSALTGFGGPDCDPALGAPGIGDCRYFNPFGSSLTGTGTVNMPELIDHIQGPYTIDANTRLTTFDGVVTGNFGALPADRRASPWAPRSGRRKPTRTTASLRTGTPSCSSWATPTSPAAGR